MLDLQMTANGDLAINDSGDIAVTDSVRQAVRIRLLWFLDEWRLGPEMGLPYFDDVFAKNPSESKIRNMIRSAVMEVDEVTDVNEVTISFENAARTAHITVLFSTDDETYKEEVSIDWLNTD